MFKAKAFDYSKAYDFNIKHQNNTSFNSYPIKSKNLTTKSFTKEKQKQRKLWNSNFY